MVLYVLDRDTWGPNIVQGCEDLETILENAFFLFRSPKPVYQQPIDFRRANKI